MGKAERRRERIEWLENHSWAFCAAREFIKDRGFPLFVKVLLSPLSLIALLLLAMLHALLLISEFPIRYAYFSAEEKGGVEK